MEAEKLIGGLVAAALAYGLVQVAYNLWFHPLAKYPGPLLARATNLWFVKETIKGKLPFAIHKLQQTYGEVVRIRPNELAYTSSDSWKQIYGHRSGRPENPKDDNFYFDSGRGPKNIIGADRERHGQMRRLLSHGFSEKALREQEGTVQKYANMFIYRLHEVSNGGKNPVNMVQWYNFFTFDVIGDLAYGEPYDCLKTGQYHPWISVIFGSIKFGSMMRLLNLYPSIRGLVKHLIPKKLVADRMANMRLSDDKATRRRNAENKTHDLVYRMAEKDSGITDDEFAANTTTLIIAGSETTATLLSGVTYLLTENPGPLKLLTEEVRSSFSSEEEITFLSVKKLKYMLACLDEALRMYPPVPIGLPRVTAEPMVIADRPIPKDTVCATYQWASYRSEKNFHRPTEFLPERWLEGGTEEFRNDNKQMLQPFSVGARNCIGRNLAYVEMQLALAKLIFNFDLEGTPESKDWDNQKVYTLWEKGPLMVKLKPVREGPKLDLPPVTVE